MKQNFNLTYSQILNICPDEFEETALQLFRWQARACSPYKRYLDLLEVEAQDVKQLTQIPFLPVDLFRKEPVVSGDFPLPELVFESSGTSGNDTSRHYVADSELYKAAARRAFELRYGNLRDYCILALLPHYLERQHSSLVYMVRDFMEQSGHPDNGFYLHEQAQLKEKLVHLRANSQKTILIGVSYALMDFAAAVQLDFPDLILMETGGMKGRRQELSREELHRILAPSFGVKQVHSEYGMTELLSQSYSTGGNQFFAPPWMRVLIRENYNPMRYVPDGVTGGINVIDLANMYSCAFIELQDSGIRHEDGSFAVLGRLKNSPVRGCNLLVE